jgi:ATP-binding cassette subfamily G (WHITE) protein 2 (SNQ2)
VSIAEMMITSATVLAWDNSTRGLDASTALDFARRDLAKSRAVEASRPRVLLSQANTVAEVIIISANKTTTFVSLYQASENIYKQFDKVLVIDNGRQVFFNCL